MLEIQNKTKSELNFIMQVESHRTIKVSWDKLEDVLKSGNNFKKQLVFIDPIVLSQNPSLITLEQKLENVIIIPTNIGEKEKELGSLLLVLKTLETEGVSRRSDMVYAVGGGVLLDVVSFASGIYRRGCIS